MPSISISAVKNQYFSRVLSTGENADICTSRNEKYFVFSKTNINIYSKPRKRNVIYFLVVFLSFSVYTIGCKQRLHLQNGLE